MLGLIPPPGPGLGRFPAFEPDGRDPHGRLVSMLVVATVILLLAWAVSLLG